MPREALLSGLQSGPSLHFYNPAQALAWSPIFLPAKQLEHHRLWFGRLQNVTLAAKVDALSRPLHPLEGGCESEHV
jgi:hypothetical protein